MATRSTTKKKTSARGKPPARGKTTASQMATRRQIVGGAYIVLAFLTSLPLFNANGFILDFFQKLFMGSMGKGFYILPLCLFGAGLIFIIKRRGKARMPATLVLALPFVLGMISHLWGANNQILWNDFQGLYTTGVQGASGGVICGSVAAVLALAISPLGALILCVALFFGLFFLAFKINPLTLAGRLRLPEEEEEDPVPAPKTATRGEPSAFSIPSLFHKKEKTIDIPLDTPINQEAEVKIPPSVVEGIAPPNVKTPAQAMASINSRGQVPDFEDELTEEDAVIFSGDPPPVIEEPKAEVVEQIPTVNPPATIPAPAPTPVDLEETARKVSREIEEMLQKHAASETPAYLYPPVSLLKQSTPPVGDLEEESKALADRLVDTLLSFGVDTSIVGVTRGPTVTRYELTLQRGTKFSRVSNLSEDIALSLGAASVRISTIPDKLAIGIEVPNTSQQMVTIRDIIDSREFRGHPSKICFPVGRDISNSNIVGDITKMPHMLIAGTTGSGKSVCINSILISLLYKSSPDEVRLIMIDPKMIELGVYNGIPHLLIPVVTDPKKASGALNWAVSEMMRRYKLLSEVGVRDLASYNAEIRTRGEGDVLPQIVIVIDELADLMFVAANEVEEAIARIAQMARAAGMHLIIATQRPSADIITGIMKANIPSRIAFAVASQIESRIILDTMGAEKLIGKGDMLYAPLGVPKPMRVQGCFITTSEVEAVVEFVKKTGVADYSKEILEHIETAAQQTGKGGSSGATGGGDDDDAMLNPAIEVIVETGQASVSMLQRRLKLGYSRAARLVDQMEERGIVGPFEGSKPRQVLISRSEWQEMVLRSKDL